jgi:uncharacterized membrane protein/glutaredoxin
MIGISLYLTKHFYDLNYLSSGVIETKSGCNLNAYLSCDSATKSPMSNIGGVPIAFLGVVIGVSFLFVCLYPKRKLIETNKLLALINGLGCAILLLISIFYLKTICPFCTLYYVLSWTSLYLFFRINGKKFHRPDLRYVSLLFLITFGGGISLKIFSTTLFPPPPSKPLMLGLEEQFDNLAYMGYPKIESPFVLIRSTEFSKAKINVIIYSDFQCPFCKITHEIWNSLALSYAGKINIHFYHFPLDIACNPKMSRPLHNLACKAAYVASCSQNFKEVHDTLFKNQDNLSEAWLDNKIRDLKIEKCINDLSTKKKIVELINSGDKFNIDSTPTIILNGKKIPGSLTENQYRIILNSILNK